MEALRAIQASPRLTDGRPSKDAKARMIEVLRTYSGRKIRIASIVPLRGDERDKYRDYDVAMDFNSVFGEAGWDVSSGTYQELDESFRGLTLVYFEGIPLERRPDFAPIATALDAAGLRHRYAAPRDVQLYGASPQFEVPVLFVGPT